MVTRRRDIPEINEWFREVVSSLKSEKKLSGCTKKSVYLGSK